MVPILGDRNTQLCPCHASCYANESYSNTISKAIWSEVGLKHPHHYSWMGWYCFHFHNHNKKLCVAAGHRPSTAIHLPQGWLRWPLLFTASFFISLGLVMPNCFPYIEVVPSWRVSAVWIWEFYFQRILNLAPQQTKCNGDGACTTNTPT